jgi:signal transduction histidine kinase
MPSRLGGLLSPLRIAAIYLAFGLAALLFSDVLLVTWIDDPALLRDLQTAKGALEVGVTAGLIYALVRSYQRASERDTEEIERARDSFAFLNKLLRHHVLNRMNVVLGRLEQVSVQGERDEELLDTVTNQSQAVVDLVQQVRTLAHTLEGNVELEHADLVSLLEERVAAFEDRFEAADVESDLPERVPVEADDALSLAVDELLQNAVEHHDAAAPRIRVSLEADGDTANVRVADDGPGIPDEEKEGAFEKGVRGNEGNGL